MSAVTATPAALPAALRSGADAPVPFTRLVEVELRKLVDTRSGRWLLAGLAAMIALVLGVAVAVSDPEGRSFARLLALAQQPASIIIPILGILTATSEWARRTVLTTFALTPSRPRVLAAKTSAGVLLALASVAATFVFAAVAALAAPIAGTTAADWSVGPADVGEYVAYQTLYLLLGIALGSLLMNAAAAIVVFLAFPPVWFGIGSAFPGIEATQRWIDPGLAWEQLVADTPMTGVWWARLGTTAAVWLLVPLALGVWRQLVREVD